MRCKIDIRDPDAFASKHGQDLLKRLREGQTTKEELLRLEDAGDLTIEQIEFAVKRRWISVETITVEAKFEDDAVAMVEAGEYEVEDDASNIDLWEGEPEVFPEDSDPAVDKINALRAEFDVGSFGSSLETFAWRKGANDALDRV